VSPNSGSAATSAVAVRCRGVDRAYALPTMLVVALRAVDLDVPTTGLTVVTGPSGCGKTTLLSLVTGTQPADAGTVEVLDTDIAQLSAARRRRLRRRSLGIVLSRPSDNLVGRLDVAANVRMAARLRKVAPDVDASLAALELPGDGRKRVAELSGGEQQRLAIALALLGDPRLVLLDEPTAELDARTARTAVEYLRSHASQRALLVASHDPCVVDAADTLVTLEAGRRVG
jgi:putative ABC transport system ATP-binding protein